MAFCPGCGYEFREGLKRCPDCDMDLVASLEEVDNARARRLRGGKTVSIFSAPQRTVEMLAEMLKQEGIASIVKGSASGAAQGLEVATQGSRAELHVLERDAEVHRDLIQELIAEVAGQSDETGA